VTGCVEVHLGPDANIDPGVILGYPPGRPGAFGEVRIGRGARVRSGSVIYAAVEIGEDFETGHHAIVREENRIGSHCTLWNNSTIDYGCVIGGRVRIHCNVYIAQFTTLEDATSWRPASPSPTILIRSAPSACRDRRFAEARESASTRRSCRSSRSAKTRWWARAAS
jgi:carbonic anhydrase/acetyltransferase-like protein (isoleucine patch superfamily)